MIGGDILNIHAVIVARPEKRNPEKRVISFPDVRNAKLFLPYSYPCAYIQTSSSTIYLIP